MTINNDKIVEIAQRSPTAEDFFTYAALRQRDVRNGVTQLTRVRAQMKQEGYHPVPQDLLSMFRELERAGVGKLAGNDFKWFTSIKDVGQAVFSPETLPAKPAIRPAPVPPAPTSRTLVIVLGDNKEIALQFTPNLNQEDIEFITSRLLKECK